MKIREKLRGFIKEGIYSGKPLIHQHHPFFLVCLIKCFEFDCSGSIKNDRKHLRCSDGEF